MNLQKSKPLHSIHNMMNVENFGEVVRDIRLGSGYTLRSFADLLGVSYSFLCRLENGKRNASPSTKSKIIASLKENGL